MDIKDKSLILTKAVVTAIPYIGGTITSVWSDIESMQAMRKINRLEEFYSSLNEEIISIKDKLNHDFISQPDYLDIFERTTKYIINERTSYKRNLYKNIFIQGMINPISDYDKTERFLRTVDEMSNLELLLLKVFWNPKKYNMELGEKIEHPNQSRSGVRHLSTYTKTYNIHELLSLLLPDFTTEDIDDALYFLESNRLVLDKTSGAALRTNGHPISLLEDKLTSKGNEFITYILR